MLFIKNILREDVNLIENIYVPDIQKEISQANKSIFDMTTLWNEYLLLFTN